ncbi:peptidase M1 [Nonlabens sp. YIK11]|nr:peptidase M1 [Nonlabens sp. YIK11]
MRFLFVLLFFTFLTTQNYAQGIDQPAVDFQSAKVQITMDPAQEMVSGTVTFDINILQDTDQILIDAKNIVEFTASSTTHPSMISSQNDAGIVVKYRFRESEKTTITIAFKSQPNKAMYFIDSDVDGRWEQAWTQGQGKYTSNWLPSIDDMNEKMEWDISVTAPDDLTVVANGNLISKKGEGDQMTWNYDMTHPMSSYLVAVVVGNYAISTATSQSGVPLDMYYYPEDEQKVSSTFVHTKEIFDFLENEIGIAYPWQNYKQIPVKDFLYAGMENTGTTIFDDQFVQDELGAVDRSYVTVNAHELAHQWFGDLVTAASGTHHWLHEGFATYYAMLAERHLYGDEHYHVNLYEQAELLNEQNQSGKSTALLDPAASSLTFYQHGAWAIHALRDLVGDAAFKAGIKRFLKEYAFKNATTDDFLDIMSQESGKDLASYKATWLTSNQFPSNEALRLLRKDLFMEAYLQLLARRISPFQEALNSYKETLQPPVQKQMVLEMVGQLSLHEDTRKYDLLERAAATNNLEIRQLITLTAQEINDYNKEMISGMLTDASYATRENALVLLWNAATDKARLLKTAKKAWSTTNESLDMAWLTLAINSTGFSNNDRTAYLGQLQEYTKPIYSTSTRQTAFDYLIALGYLDDQNYLDLYQAALHHNYRFYQYARKLVNEQYAKEANKPLMEKVVELLTEREQENLRLVTDL